MESIVNAWDPLVASLVLASAMLAAWGLGSWAARRRPPRAPGSGPDKYSDLLLALLGLLLAFTFSISLAQHGDRRQAVAAGANAIGDFHTCADLQTGSVRAHLLSHLPEYVETQMELAQPLTDEARLQEILGRIDGLHGAMHQQVRLAVEAGTPTVEPLVDTFNAMTSAMTSRLSARRARLPGAVMLVLVVVSVLSTGLLGWQGDRASSSSIVGAMAFIAVVSLVVWVTLDLNRPYAGWTRVSQEPMERLLANVRK